MENSSTLMQIKADDLHREYARRMSNHTLIAADEAKAIKIAEAAQIAPAGIVSRTVLHSPEARVVLFTFADGQELTSHTSARRALVQILDGSCEFFFGGRWERLEAGSFVSLPPHHPHAVRANAGVFSMLLILAAEPVSSVVASTSNQGRNS